MNNTRSILKYDSLLFAIVLAIALFKALGFSQDVGKIASGMISHTLCTNVLMLNRNRADVEARDLSALQRRFASSHIDVDAQTVTSSFGLGPFGNTSTAVYRDGCGCGVTGNFEVNQIKEQSAPEYKELSIDSIEHWPSVNRAIDGVNFEKLNSVVNNAFTESSTVNDSMKNSRAILIHYKGELIAEQYGEGFDGDMPLRGMSMTKSIISALAGVLDYKDKLDINDKTGLPAYEEADDARKDITIHQILKMTVGYDYNEAYESDPTNLLSTMLMTQGDMADFANDVELRAVPKETWDYQTVHSVLLSKIVRNHTGSQEEYLKLVHEDFFDKAGMNHSFLQADASGTFIGGAFAYCSPRDWMRFGLLYLNNGLAQNGQRVFTADWAKYTNTPSDASLKSRAYGAQFWLNAKSQKQWIPNAPEDMFAAKGHYGQYVVIVPSLELVIVRLGMTFNKEEFNIDDFIRDVIATLK